MAEALPLARAIRVVAVRRAGTQLHHAGVWGAGHLVLHLHLCQSRRRHRPPRRHTHAALPCVEDAEPRVHRHRSGVAAPAFAWGLSRWDDASRHRTVAGRCGVQDRSSYCRRQLQSPGTGQGCVAGLLWYSGPNQPGRSDPRPYGRPRLQIRNDGWNPRTRSAGDIQRHHRSMVTGQCFACRTAAAGRRREVGARSPVSATPARITSSVRPPSESVSRADLQNDG